MRLWIAMIMTAGLGLAASPASAFEPITYSTTADNVAVPVADTGFDWNGFYAGVYGVAALDADGDMRPGLGVDLGVNARFEFYLVGAEVTVQSLGGDSSVTSGQLVGRAGLVVTDDVVAYAAAGYGLDFGDAGNNQFLIGGGLEVAVTDDWSLRGQYLLGVPADGGDTSSQVSLGAAFHF